MSPNLFLLLLPEDGGQPDFSNILSSDAEGSDLRVLEGSNITTSGYVFLQARLSREDLFDSNGNKIHYQVGKFIGFIIGQLPIVIDPQERFALLCSGNKWAVEVLTTVSGTVISLEEAWEDVDIQAWMLLQGINTIEGRPKLDRVYVGRSLDPLATISG